MRLLKHARDLSPVELINLCPSFISSQRNHPMYYPITRITCGNANSFFGTDRVKYRFCTCLIFTDRRVSFKMADAVWKRLWLRQAMGCFLHLASFRNGFVRLKLHCYCVGDHEFVVWFVLKIRRRLGIGDVAHVIFNTIYSTRKSRG